MHFPDVPKSIPPDADKTLKSPSDVTLAYETIGAFEKPGPRPAWVYAVAGVYAILLLAFLTFPAWTGWAFGPADNELAFVIVSIATIAVCGLSLMIIPVRNVRRRPITRRSIWIPILGSGFLAALLVGGGGLALFEYLMAGSDQSVWVLIAALFVWAAWAVVFGLVASSGRERGVGLWLHRWLIAGSVLELLVAVPTHIVVRRRHDCCGGIATGLGICVGVIVMFFAFGPSVLLLFYRRRKQITKK